MSTPKREKKQKVRRKTYLKRKIQKAQLCTNSEKNRRERLEKKILRAMIGSLGKVK